MGRKTRDSGKKKNCQYGRFFVVFFFYSYKAGVGCTGGGGGGEQIIFLWEVDGTSRRATTIPLGGKSILPSRGNFKLWVREIPLIKRLNKCDMKIIKMYVMWYNCTRKFVTNRV